MNFTSNGTFLLQVSAKQEAYTTHLKSLEKNNTYDFDFSVMDCDPIEWLDDTEKKIVFGNHTIITYFHNNGTERTPLDFFNTLKTRPSCKKDKYVPVFEINYPEIMILNKDGIFERIDSKTVGAMKQYFKTDYKIVD